MDIRKIIRALLRADPLDSCIDRDEQVVFFPTVGDLDQGRWRIPIHGWIYRPAEFSRLRRMGLWVARRLLSRRVRRDPEGMKLFKQRAGAFLADNERWERMQIQLGDAVFKLKRSGADGHFQGQLELPADRVEMWLGDGGQSAATGGGRWMSFRAITRSEDARVFDGRVLLLPAEGRSVISDIDDTIKVTEVGRRRSMLRKTFLEEFASVPEMAPLYRRWAGTGAEGAAFHYVSASPWHLYPFLAEFLKGQGFPQGTFHLREFRLMPGNLRHTLRASRRIKLRHARELLSRFPRRRFILVGDSGESDAEIYAKLYKEFPGQVEQILIRNVTGEDADKVRWQRVFKCVPRAHWHVFQTPAEIDSWGP